MHDRDILYTQFSKEKDPSWMENYHKLYKAKGNQIISDREKRVVIDGHSSDCAPVTAGVPQGSILGPLLSLVYINDITEVVQSDIRIFADDTFIFRQVDANCTQELYEDLCRITEWGHQWKMPFNPDLSKQAVEVI